jgi:hypothetical protein
MTKKFVTRALMIAGLLVAGVSASFAQQSKSIASTVRRVPVDKEKSQPVAASTVIMKSSMQLNADQRAKVTALDQQVAALHSERARLWDEYRAVRARADFDDNMAAAEAAPRMHRIVEINAQLEPLVAKQETQLASILNSSQRAQVARLMTDARANF